MRMPTVGYVFLCGSALGGMGLSGEYLSRSLPENHASFSSIGVGLGFFALAFYFGFSAIARICREGK